MKKVTVFASTLAVALFISTAVLAQEGKKEEKKEGKKEEKKEMKHEGKHEGKHEEHKGAGEKK